VPLVERSLGDSPPCRMGGLGAAASPRAGSSRRPPPPPAGAAVLPMPAVAGRSALAHPPPSPR